MTRLARGGLIDRTEVLEFSFDGRAYWGYEGDTLASALIANDVKLIGRSFKYHRPRGVVSAGSEEPNALVTLWDGAHALPNTKAPGIKLTPGLAATSQNRWPSLSMDIMAINQVFAPLLVAGFYYKTFKWPSKFWEFIYEPLIRRAAGLGALSGLPDPDNYARAHAFCDLLVIGGGPSGLACALVAARGRLKVIVANEDWEFGGRVLSENQFIDGVDGVTWARSVVAELRAYPNVTLLSKTAVFGVFDGHEYGALQTLHNGGGAEGMRQRYWKIIAKQSVLAAGAVERPIVFGNNDRPGVMLASALETYVYRFAASPGERIAIFTATDSGWRVAQRLIDAGLTVVAVVDPRSKGALPKLRSAGQGAVPVYAESCVVDAHGSPLNSIITRGPNGTRRRVVCDVLGVSGGWMPSIGLASNLGQKPAWSPEIHAFVAADTPAGMEIAGAAAGQLSLQNALKSGVAAAERVASRLGKKCPSLGIKADLEATSGAAFWCVHGHRAKAFVDLQHDVTDMDIELAAREGYASVELMKRYTTTGMATDQGRTSQLNAHALLAAATGREVGAVGTIQSRPPFVPVEISAFAGHHKGAHFRPTRKTATHEWAAARGAPFVDAGQWKRAQYFPLAGETDWLASVNREVQSTRSAVGICDVSTLGKIDVHGADAGLLLDRLYINNFSTLGIGKVRYGAMLRDDGMVFDDGTVSRIAVEHYFVTTTTANAARVMSHIDYARQVLWPELDVQATSVTEQWATFAVAGPHSRALLERVLQAPLGNDVMAFMTTAAMRWRDIISRVFRVSFSGELAFEISVPATFGLELFDDLMEKGAELGAVPYGTEALGVMRIEKGHPAGPELNGQTTADDIGLGALMSKKKDFIGKTLSARPGLTDPERPQLVGLRPLDRTAKIPAGSHLLCLGAKAQIENDQGWVSSAAYSPTLGHAIALAFVKRGRDRIGEQFVAHDPIRDGNTRVTICSSIFVDPEGMRVRG